MSKAIDIPRLIDRPGWIPADIKDNWDTDPYAYITEDEFMSAGAFHNRLIAWFMEVLSHFLAQRQQALLPDVLMLYRDGQGIRQRIAPDLSLVASSDALAYSYNLDIRPPPLSIIEFISPDSKQDDTEKKVVLYEQLGVQEYLAIDLTDTTVSALYFWRRVSEQFQRVDVSEHGVNLEAMGVNIRLHEGSLQLIDLATGHLLEDNAMSIARAEGEKRRADNAEQRAEAQAGEIAELKAALARLRDK